MFESQNVTRPNPDPTANTTPQGNANLSAIQLAVGKIITIETCYGCKTHSFSTWHTEERYTRVFEEVKDEIQAQNPDVEVVRNTGPGSKRGAFEIYHGEFLLFSKIACELWPGPHWISERLHSYFDDLANGRDISKYENMVPDSMRRSSIMRSSLRNSQIGNYAEDSIVGSPVAGLSDEDKEELDRKLREKRELERLNKERLEKERKEREREQEERDRLARERREKERLAREQEKKERAKDDNKNDSDAKKFKLQKGSRKLAKALLIELSYRLEKSITTPLLLGEKTLVDFINTKGVLTDPDTYAEPWELALEDADNVKGSLIATIYRYFDLMRFPEQVKQLDFDVRDSNGYTPLGIALGGGMALTNCFINETSVETNDSTVALSGFFTLKNTVTHLINLAEKAQSKITPELRNDEKNSYTTLHDVLLRHIFSPLPYNQSDQSLINIDGSTDGDMNKLRDECNKILEKLDLSKVDTEDLAVAAFKDKEVFEQLKTLMGNPKEFYGAKGMHKDFIENMVTEYNASKVESTFWGGSSILAFAGTKFLEGILGLKGVKYNPYKRNPISGAYSFVWNAAPMEVTDLECIINIGKKYREEEEKKKGKEKQKQKEEEKEKDLKLEQIDDFGFSFLNYTQIAIHNGEDKRERMLDFLERKFNFNLKGYHSYSKASKQGAGKKKREALFRWTQRVTNKAKWEIRYVSSVQDSYLYKTVLQELSQETSLKSLSKYDISSEMLAHIAREICCWKGSVYDEELSEDRAHRINKFLSYLNAREKQKQTQNPAPNSNQPQTQAQPAAQGQPQGQSAPQPIIEFKKFYEGSKRCNCKIISNKIQAMPDGQDNLSGLFISIVDKPRPVSDKPSDTKSASPVQPVSYAEIALLIYLSLEKGSWQSGYETFRSNSLWAGLCFDCFQRFKDSLPRDKTIKTEPNQAKAQVLSRLTFESAENPEMLKKYLEYTKSSKLELDLKTEFDGLNIMEKILQQSSSKGVKEVAKIAQSLLITYMIEAKAQFNLNHKNRRNDNLLDKFRDEPEVLKALSEIVEKAPELFVFYLDSAKGLKFDPDFAEKLRYRCELLRLSDKAQEALKILDQEEDRLRKSGIEEDLETLYLRAKLYEALAKKYTGNAKEPPKEAKEYLEKTKEVYKRIATKYDSEKNRVVLTSVLGNEKMKLSKDTTEKPAESKKMPETTGEKDSLSEALYQLTNLDNNTNDFTQVKVDFNKMDLLLKLGNEREALHLLSDKFPKLLGIDLEPTLGKEKAEFIKKTVTVFQKALVLSPEELKDPKAKNLKADQVRSFVSQMTACINQGMNSDDVKKLSEKLGVTEKQIEEMNQILKASGMVDEAQINKEFNELKKKDINKFHYAINFYWTLQNYLEVERMMSTNMFMVNRDEFEKQTHQKTFAKIVAKKIADTAGDALSEVPVFGGLAKMVIKAVDWYFEKVDEKAEHDHTNAINLVLRYYPGAVMKTAEVNRYAARAALEIAKKKGSLKPKEDNSIVGKIKQVAEDLQTAIIGKEVELYSQPEALAAYQDVIIVIIYIAKQYQDLVDEKKQGKETFAEMIEYIITKERYKGTLKEQTVEGPAPEKRSACCEMF